MNNETTATKQMKAYLTFKLNHEVFALGVDKVVEIMEVPRITKVPKAPDYMKGVINLRGQVLPVIDTRIKFGLAPIELGKDHCIIVINMIIDDKTMYFGALVDQVLEVLEMDEETMLPTPNVNSKYDMRFIQGLLKEGDDFVMVLDIDHTFSIEEIEAIKENNQDQ
ncbi:chemotaxis protein CheW [Fulvivirga maritima]|uniref:chemotaxis protein CheW n=1 Tax=Fulvivirga maritima TaxID=2904247 RepID=UPI001F256D94|nr:chemotaxis protein CheW [Fulvivirga maritima]UII25411.1 chemotaxis protein CheW [Fulvivirga maritima]